MEKLVPGGCGCLSKSFSSAHDLGYERDFEGKNISNHYFAAKINYGNEEKIVFCRVRETDGSEERFYVHEVFTEDEIKKGTNLVPTVGRLSF